MTIFSLRNRLVDDYRAYVESFIEIRDPAIRDRVGQEFAGGLLWPEPLLQLNPFFAPGDDVDTLVREGVLHPECGRIFRKDKTDDDPEGKPLRLHRHQSDAVRVARGEHNYVLTTGTGSGKSLAYMIPIVDRVLRNGTGHGVQAIVVYPMNALANSQYGELEKFLRAGYPGGPPVRFERYTGQEDQAKRGQILDDPPDILLTNYVMLELILTRVNDRRLVESARDLRFLVLDELHTYRGRQGADVSMLVRRVRDLLEAERLQCVGTSATLAGEGGFDQQRAEVALVASQVFGADVHPEHVIGETLRRVTPELDVNDPAATGGLASCAAGEAPSPATREEFLRTPLASWIETTFGIVEKDGRLVRATPRSIGGESGGAELLSRRTGVDAARCRRAIEQALLDGFRFRDPETGKPVFAFRLHQFISRGDTVYATLEAPEVRQVALQAQQFAPNDRGRILLPLAFCRECGQEYYSVRVARPAGGSRVFADRDPSDRLEEEGKDLGFLFVGEVSAPAAEGDAADETGGYPDAERIRVSLLGVEDDAGTACLFLPAPFRRCLGCGVEYNARQRSDFSKLGTLGSEGRSTATTILSLSSVRALREAANQGESLAAKLLSFTDNRQDASLQAGHFNDFVEIATLRAALYRAVLKAGPDGVTHEELTQRVFDALALPFDAYAADPGVLFQAEQQTKRALREVLGYRLYRDLKRGWRVVMPNLEQSGLLEIRYQSLKELCEHELSWQRRHPALAAASPQVRMAVARTLLDFMRRELAIRVNYLDAGFQESLRQLSGQRLRAPWALDESETLEYARTLYPRPSSPGDWRGHVYLSPRSGFGLYLKRAETLPHWTHPLNEEARKEIIHDLLQCLRVAGLVEQVEDPRPGDVPGYQLPASALLWVAGDGTQAFHDPIRVPSAPARGGRVNPYFVELYRQEAAALGGLEAREHTAQVKYEKRLERESDFRTGKLPILYCSPTMELGVDIADLNTVSLRNVPPTPANYAQRSGRAGRSGQPALVFTYCSSGSSHDQYFFKRPELMVSGAVAPPRIDLANEDLVRSHVHAVWLTEVALDLGGSVKDILDLEDEDLPLAGWVREKVEDAAARQRARTRAAAVLASMGEELERSDWFGSGWLDGVLEQVVREFDTAVDRWRDLYRAARMQQAAQNAVVLDVARAERERNEARRLRSEAEAQIKLLTGTDEGFQSDFYSYRYFASEGFLPGYNFPRLPLSAFIPARQVRDRDEYLQRPRFLAISEFGPQAVVYHEGSKYVINKVILPPDAGEELTTSRMKQCGRCGYAHPVAEGDGPDLCEQCGEALTLTLRPLFRLQNVATKRRDRINSDEEERFRLGYEIRTGVRFVDHGEKPSQRVAVVRGANGAELGTLRYGHAATIYRVNLGWRRRKHAHVHGFVLDVERGYWESNAALDEQGREDPLSGRAMRVIPFVEDRRNALIFEPAAPLGAKVMASLQAALKSAIQIHFQLEDQELAAEPLPDWTSRNRILFFEASEGGAGVLRRLVDADEAEQLSAVARRALDLCHFDPATGVDLRRAPRATEDCEAACYNCLMSYGNQLDHGDLDRQKIRGLLLELAAARVEPRAIPSSRAEHAGSLADGDGVEARWVRWLQTHDLRLPSRARPLLERCGARPDFVYDDEYAAVYVDGGPERAARDAERMTEIEDFYTVIRFGPEASWDETVRRFGDVFRRRA